MKNNAKNLMIGVCALALFALAPVPSDAAEIKGKTRSYTGAKTTINNDLDSSVTTGDNVRINGGIRTGTNTTNTDVKTNVESDTDTRVINHDNDPAPGKSGTHRKDQKRKSWWSWGD